MEYFILAIVFMSIAIVLIYSPSQLFSRHDPVMIRIFNSATVYRKFIKYFGYLLLCGGVIILILGIYNLIA